MLVWSNRANSKKIVKFKKLVPTFIQSMELQDKENRYLLCKFERVKNSVAATSNTENKYTIAFRNKSNFYKGSVVELSLPEAEMCTSKVKAGKVTGSDSSRSEIEEILENFESENEGENILIVGLNSRVDEQDFTISQQSHEICELKNTVSQQSQEICELKNTVSQQKITISQQSEEICELKNTVSQLISKVDEMERYCKTLMGEMKRVNQYSFMLESEIKDFSSQFETVNHNLEATTEQLEQSTSRIHIQVHNRRPSFEESI